MRPEEFLSLMNEDTNGDTSEGVTDLGKYELRRPDGYVEPRLVRTPLKLRSMNFDLLKFSKPAAIKDKFEGESYRGTNP